MQAHPQTRRPLAPILALFFLVALGACSKNQSQDRDEDSGFSHAEFIEGDNNEEDDYYAQRQPLHDKVYRVVSETYFPPFVMLDGKGGVVGFESDLLNAIGEIKNVSFVYVTHPWNGIFDTIDQSKNDVVAASVTITPERAGKWNFSEPYYASQQTFFSLQRPVFADNPLETLEDRRIVVKRGTTSDILLKKHIPDRKNILYFDSVFTGVKEIINRRADGIMGDSGPLQYYAAKYHQFLPIVRQIPGQPVEFYGFVVSKNRKDDLLEIIDDGLAQLKKNGEYERLYVKWFESPPGALPTLKQVLSGEVEEKTESAEKDAAEAAAPAAD